MPEMIKVIRDYKSGNQQAFEELYKWSLPYLTKCVLNVLNRICSGANEDLLQDVLQDTYLTIAQKIDTLQNDEAFFQWAGQIATNHALRAGKKESFGQSGCQEGEDPLLELPDERFIPEDILENKEKRDLIRAMIRELPTPQYLCVVEYFYNGLKEREIAEKLDMPLGTVKTNLSRAKKKMKEIIGTHEKKHGVKLYNMAWLLLLLFVDDLKAMVVNPAVAEETLAAVTSRLLGSGVSAGATTAVGGTAGTTVTAGGVGGTVATTVGTGSAAGGVMAGLGVKIAAGVLAAVMAVGTAVMAIGFSKRETRREEPVSTAAEMVEVSEPVLQDFTEDLTEEAEPTEPESEAETEPPIASDAFSAAMRKEGKTYCYHFPAVNGENCAEFNQKLYDKCYSIYEPWVVRMFYDDPYLPYDIERIGYFYGKKDDVVSVVIFSKGDTDSYTAYTVSLSTGKELTPEEIVGAYGLTIGEFYSKVYDDMEKDISPNDPFTNKEKSLSADNIASSIPFVGPDGSLCYEGQFQINAGSGIWSFVSSVETEEDIFNTECEVEHTDYMRELTEEEACMRLCEEYGLDPEEAFDVSLDTYCALQGLETRDDRRYYIFLMRMVHEENNYVSTLGQIWVDALTGEVRG